MNFFQGFVTWLSCFHFIIGEWQLKWPIRGYFTINLMATKSTVNSFEPPFLTGVCLLLIYAHVFKCLVWVVLFALWFFFEKLSELKKSFQRHVCSCWDVHICFIELTVKFLQNTYSDIKKSFQTQLLRFD